MFVKRLSLLLVIIYLSYSLIYSQSADSKFEDLAGKKLLPFYGFEEINNITLKIDGVSRGAPRSRVVRDNHGFLWVDMMVIVFIPTAMIRMIPTHFLPISLHHYF